MMRDQNWGDRCADEWIAGCAGDADVVGGPYADGDFKIPRAAGQWNEMRALEVVGDPGSYAPVACGTAVDEDLVGVLRKYQEQCHVWTGGGKAEMEAVPDEADGRVVAGGERDRLPAAVVV